MTREERIAQLTPMLLGNVSAAQFITLVIEALHIWDDLIDKDKQVQDAAINDVFYSLFVVLPRNEFYKQHFSYLNPILVNAITNWHIANQMERQGDDYQLRIAYILRSSYVDLTTQCAVLVGGLEHGVDIGFRNRLFAHKETWEGYLINLDNEQQARTSLLSKE